jgi:signal transduction histidine kinase/ligand-binding sensor domain-containing protein/AraC-like DNA-binding protein/AmiR/NasT family two-component response regulator
MKLTQLTFCLALLFEAVFCKTAVAQQLYFSTLLMKDGLPSNIISGIAQDEDDFIWVGTGNGLARFDGYQFKTFKKSSSSQSLTSNEISCLLQSGENIWIGTWNGLCKINTRTFVITRIASVGNQAIRTLAKGLHGDVWVGTENGLLQLNETSLAVAKTYHTNNSGLSHNTIRSIYEDRDGNLWVGTYDKLNKLAKDGGLFQTFDLKEDYKPSLKNNLICGEIKPVQPGSDSLLWIGTETGLSLFNTQTHQVQRWSEQQVALSNEVIKCIYLNESGRVWLGTDFGLNILDPATKKVTSYFHNPQAPFSLANNAIWQIFEDRSGVIWLVTSNGLSRVNKHPNQYYFHEVSSKIENQTVGNQVKAIHISQNGITWLATLHGVLRIAEGNATLFDTQATPPHKLLLNNVYALAEDTLNRIWIGTAGGINIWDEPNKKMYALTATPDNGLVTNYIARFITDSDGTMWVSTYQGGLFKITGDFTNPYNIRFEVVNREFGSEKIVAGKNSLWFILNNELQRFNIKTNQEEHISLINSQNSGDIHCLFVTDDEFVLAGTQNGFIRYNTRQNKSTFHLVEVGHDIYVTNLIEDESGNIWGTTNHFIFKFTNTAEIEMFPIEKDLPLKSFYHGCATNANNGSIFFGGDNGFVSVDTRSVYIPSYKPKVYITSLEINNKLVNHGDTIDQQVLLPIDISHTSHLSLDYAHRSLTFGFAALHYWQPEINVYAYKLNGFDDDWIYVSGSKNFAVYSNLSPGNYIFQVRGTNNYGQWGEQQATIHIQVKPPLFLHPAFIVLYALLVVGGIVLAMRIYAIRIKLNNELKITRLEKNHTEELAQAKQNFFTNISHELRTPVSLILPPIHQILKEGKLDTESRSLITLAEKNSQRLLRLINQVLDFRKLESDKLHLKVSRNNLVSFTHEIHALFADKANRKKINFTFTSIEPELPVWVDVEKIETVLFNIFSNAFKFTPQGGSISVSIQKEASSEKFPSGTALIKISDTGIGLSDVEKNKIFEPFYQAQEAKQMEMGTGIGLALALEYIKLHTGYIQVDSIKGSGTTFTIYLPLGKGHFPVDYIHDEQELALVATKETFNNIQNTYRLDLYSTKPLLLIIDDNVDMIDMIRISLAHKYNFITAENGEEGLQKVISFLPELVISDVMMPVMDGLTFCKKIKENSRTSHIAIILITARGLTTQKIEGIRTGADAYLTKPFELEYLEANIDHLLERKNELTNYLKNTLRIEPSQTDKENEDERFVKKVMNIIEANISDPGFGVEQLSEEIGMSASYLYRKLKSLTQISTNDLIRKYRLKKASILLRNKGGNVTEIMYEVGFANLSYFSKCFKAEYGLNPKDFQKQMSKNSVDLDW